MANSLNQLPTARARTSPEDLAAINAMYKNVRGLMENLWARWQDEKEYEDINDYAEPIKAHLPQGFVLEKMTKRPFGFHFSLTHFKATYALTMTGRQYCWTRIS